MDPPSCSSFLPSCDYPPTNPARYLKITGIRLMDSKNDPAMAEKGLANRSSSSLDNTSPEGSQHKSPLDARNIDKYHLNASADDKVQRKLKQRHVQMIAIAGTIGTGLFLGSGAALRGAGPLGALIAYALVGTVAYSAASETENPRRNIAKAVRRVFYRIILFYVLGILIIGMCVSSDDPALLQGMMCLSPLWRPLINPYEDTGNAAESPFVIAINRAGIKVLPHIINACVFTSAFSAGNSYLFCASRVLYGLALRGQAPRFLAYCTKNGLPVAAVIASSAFAFLSFMNVSSGSETVFNWFVNLSTVAGFFLWWSINITYTRFNRAMKVQGYDVTANVYHNRLQPYLAYWGIFWTTIFILINGFEVFFDFQADDFVTAYINIPIFFALFLGYKIVGRTRFWRAHEMDLWTGVPSIEETESPEVPPTTVSEKIAAFLF
ncbi:hypothetical protein CCMSSC00406_0006836 [Pleurotus cornucopiae]|uniref:Uncharacterized protein n=1 Tax=Pleurotus cornucopiae TaxID=5321 RepID=A0ACB7J0V4_PLECO|nr:hypothetical protein CCMSSC00406_0006836 [Pleurotus cornucopiae]